MKHKVKKGFTLVELVVVIAVIAILVAVLIPTFAGILGRARANERYQMATNARKEFYSANENMTTTDELEGYVFAIDDTYLYKVEDGELKEDNDLDLENDYQEVDVDGVISNPDIISVYEPVDNPDPEPEPEPEPIVDPAPDPEPEPEEEYFITISAETAVTVKPYNSSKNWNGTIEYSLDKTEWETWNGSTAISSNDDNEIYLRGKNNTNITSSSNANTRWVLTGNTISVTGNLATLLNWETVSNEGMPSMANGCFAYMFKGNTQLIYGPELPFTNLRNYCYQQMFFGCSGLLEAPELPSDNLYHYCYQQMFFGCTSLTQAPSLSHITCLANYCCDAMFQNCSSLTSLPRLNTSLDLYECCYRQMFCGCTNIKISASQTGIYQNAYTVTIDEWDDFYDEYCLQAVFYGTGGTYTNDPVTGVTYYTSNDIVE